MKSVHKFSTLFSSLLPFCRVTLSCTSELPKQLPGMMILATWHWVFAEAFLNNTERKLCPVWLGVKREVLAWERGCLSERGELVPTTGSVPCQAEQGQGYVLLLSWLRQYLVLYPWGTAFQVTVCKIGINLTVIAIPKRSGNVFPSIFSMWESLGTPQGLACDNKAQLSQQDLRLRLGVTLWLSSEIVFFHW